MRCLVTMQTDQRLCCGDKSHHRVVHKPKLYGSSKEVIKNGHTISRENLAVRGLSKGFVLTMEKGWVRQAGSV